MDGVWLPWADWAECSKTCGNGLRVRKRQCDGPFYGGANCTGDWEDAEFCNPDPCPGIHPPHPEHPLPFPFVFPHHRSLSSSHTTVILCVTSHTLPVHKRCSAIETHWNPSPRALNSQPACVCVTNYVAVLYSALWRDPLPTQVPMAFSTIPLCDFSRTPPFFLLFFYLFQSHTNYTFVLCWLFCLLFCCCANPSDRLHCPEQYALLLLTHFHGQGMKELT